MAQFDKGKPKNNGFDSSSQREEWFHQCMLSIIKLEGVKSIAFPYQIGCGLAGGNWENYYKMITKFTENNPQIQFVMYKYVEKKEPQLNSTIEYVD